MHKSTEVADVVFHVWVLFRVPLVVAVSLVLMEVLAAR